MDTRYLLVDVQEIRIQPYFCIKQGDYFFSLFLGHRVYIRIYFLFLGLIFQSKTERNLTIIKTLSKIEFTQLFNLHYQENKDHWQIILQDLKIRKGKDGRTNDFQ